MSRPINIAVHNDPHGMVREAMILAHWELERIIFPVPSRMKAQIPFPLLPA
jgi:hypothetical protein